MTRYFTGLLFLLIVCLNTAHGAPPAGTLKWAFPTGGGIYSSPAVGRDGTIYVGSRDFKIYAINPDGSLKWSYETEDKVDSSPAIGADGTVYVGSHDHKLYAINPDNGALRWSYSTGDYVRSSPAIGSDGTIYVGSGDYKLHSVNPDGTLKWSYAAGYGIYSSPAIGPDGTIYVGSHDAKFYAISPTGTLGWSYDTEGGMIYSSPAIGADGTIYVGSLNYTFYAFNPNGTLRWARETGGRIESSPVIGPDGTVYVGSGDHSFYLFTRGGSLKGRLDSAEGNFGSPPAIGADGTVYVGSSDGTLRAIDPATGEHGSFYVTEGAVWSSPVIGPDGTVYVGSLDGKLYAIAGSSPGPADSPWPMFRHDLDHTGNPAPQRYLTIITSGAGRGAVALSRPDTECGSTCSVRYRKGASATLTPVPESGSVFTGWTGACKGDSRCSVTMSTDITVGAVFEPGSCAYTLSSARKTFGYRGGAVTVGVAATGHGYCAAPAVINSTDWITGVAVDFKKNRGAVKFSVPALDSCLDRVTGPGGLAIEGSPVEVKQTGRPCSFSIRPLSSEPLSAAGDTETFTVTAVPSDCSWSATPDAKSAWITIESGGRGMGTGSIGYTVAPNKAGRQRNGKIVVAVGKKNKTYGVKQGTR